MNERYLTWTAFAVLLFFSILCLTCSESTFTEPIQAAQQRVEEATGYGFYAANSMKISEGSRLTGTVGVRAEGDGPRLVPGYELALGRDAR